MATQTVTKTVTEKVTTCDYCGKLATSKIKMAYEGPLKAYDLCQKHHDMFDSLFQPLTVGTPPTPRPRASGAKPRSARSSPVSGAKATTRGRAPAARAKGGSSGRIGTRPAARPRAKAATSLTNGSVPESPEVQSYAERKAEEEAMRTWGREHGYKVGARGRLSQELIDAYQTGQKQGQLVGAGQKGDNQ